MRLIARIVGLGGGVVIAVVSNAGDEDGSCETYADQGKRCADLKRGGREMGGGPILGLNFLGHFEGCDLVTFDDVADGWLHGLLEGPEAEDGTDEQPKQHADGWSGMLFQEDFHDVAHADNAEHNADADGDDDF